MVILEAVSKTFLLGQTRLEALKDIDLRVEDGEFAALVGPSGSGKTTLLNIIACIEKPSSGRVLIAGTDVTPLSFDQMADIRRTRLGFVFQNFNLLPVLNALENVEFPLLHSDLPKNERRAAALAALREVGLERFASHKPSELSGGQRQRVAIARALAGSPPVILADEPTANLDQKTGMEIVALMRELNRKSKTTFIFSTHDPKIVAQAQRVVELVDGKLARNSTCIGE